MAKGTLFTIVAALVIASAVGYMVYTTVSSGEALDYFKKVDQAMDELPKLKGRRVRLHGNVVEKTIQKKPGSLDYRFAIFHADRWIDVAYRGVVPDALKDCSEVVVNGKFSPDNDRFIATKIVGKCPSKYEERQRTSGCGKQLTSKVIAQRAGR